MLQTVPIISITFYGVIIRVGTAATSSGSSSNDVEANGVLSTIIYLPQQERSIRAAEADGGKTEGEVSPQSPPATMPTA